MVLNRSVNIEWGCLISNPDVIFRIDMINPNGRIEYHLPNDTQRHHPHLSEIKVLDENEVPLEIRLAYKAEISISQND